MSRVSPPPGRNILQQVFNLNPNTPSALLLPAVQGVMDVSQQWPLAELLKVFDYHSAGGTVQVVLSQPPAGFHELVFGAWFTTNTPAANKFSVLFKTNTQASGPTANITEERVSVDVQSQVPLIQGEYYQGGGSNIVLDGVQGIYVPFPFSLTHAYVGSANGDVVTLRTLSLRLPGSQPFSSILGLL